MKVKLLPIDKNETIDKIYIACRTCYSKGSPILGWEDADYYTEEEKLKLIKYVLGSGHYSTVEHVQLTFLIEGVSRSLTHQLVRHRHASYCLAGDTIIKIARGKKITIAEAYNRSEQYKKMMKIRCVNETTKELLYDHVSEFIHSGEKELYEVKTNFGYSIKSTLEHRFLTNNGWKRLKELSVGDTVYVNGTSVVVPDTITSIEYVGVQDTYDICMAGEHHNFIANGFVVHNSQQSQRYVEFKEGKFDYVTPKTIEKDEKAKTSFNDAMSYLANTYDNLVKLGIPAEDARAVLPNACCSNITVSMNLRELIHVGNERLCTCAQDEIRTLVREMVKEVTQQLPFLKNYLVPKCEMLGYCNEPRRSCGRKKLKSEVIK